MYSRDNAHFFHDDFGMRKLSAKYIPKYLNVDQKLLRVTTSRKICRCLEELSSNFLDWLVTMDETWVHHYNSDTKEHFKEWKHFVSPRPKKFRVKNCGKILSLVFWGKDGNLLIECLERRRTITQAYYTELNYERKLYKNGVENLALMFSICRTMLLFTSHWLHGKKFLKLIFNWSTTSTSSSTVILLFVLKIYNCRKVF